jgi:ribosome-associated translation inhibitor RaiA
MDRLKGNLKRGRFSMSDYSQTIEISAESQNHVEQAIHEFQKHIDDARRYGVDIQIRRVDVSEKDVEGFTDE